MSEEAKIVVGTYWIIWSVDTRIPVMRRHRPHRYVKGVLRPCDPAKRTAFSYLTWTRRPSGSPWSYDRNDAQRIYSLKAARLLRRYIFEEFKTDKTGLTPRACYGITRVTQVRRGVLRTPQATPKDEGK